MCMIYKYLSPTEKTGFTKTPSGRDVKKGYRPEQIGGEEVWRLGMLEKLTYGRHDVEMKQPIAIRSFTAIHPVVKTSQAPRLLCGAAFALDEKRAARAKYSGGVSPPGTSRAPA
ncbi:hypothetical protein JS73_07710 [Synergistes jonesii]|uniref:Uncharacterized protein n=1 Tax=Synergistes jonesii TaxID=2754 RepID=A0A073J318_9BACT|nr:hypothetical protein EH55_05585 [Synergistes jonesii]OFB60650.1 hypothetical protein JS72_12900 [Synergistes jonesii]OFB62324.1 hypothetical protein JS73_07710 [Synergistes jonesii]OFB63021.1 hypothetical protein JS79_08230 [Synergistes jonesii]OFB67524.1 hypothetical protein JS78_07715 [Synergistes jonesii]